MRTAGNRRKPVDLIELRSASDPAFGRDGTKLKDSQGSRPLGSLSADQGPATGSCGDPCRILPGASAFHPQMGESSHA